MNGQKKWKNNIGKNNLIYSSLKNMGITGIDPNVEVILHAGI